MIAAHKDTQFRGGTQGISISCGIPGLSRLCSSRCSCACPRPFLATEHTETTEHDHCLSLRALWSLWPGFTQGEILEMK